MGLTYQSPSPSTPQDTLQFFYTLEFKYRSQVSDQLFSNSRSNEDGRACSSYTLISSRRLRHLDEAINVGVAAVLKLRRDWGQVTGVVAYSLAGDARMATSNDTKRMLWSEDDKAHLLRTLQGRPYFEKTLVASSSSQYSGKTHKLTLPTSFVHEYGDRIQQWAILRLGSSKKAYHVHITIAYYSGTVTTVHFAGGWKAFAVANGLVEGDTVVFALTSAMSEFEVYIFRSFNKIKTRKRLSREIESSGAEYSSPMSTATDNVKSMPFRNPDGKPQVLQRLQEGLYFEETLTESNSGKHSGPTLPSWFVKKHGDSIQETVVLRTESSTKSWPVTLEISIRSPTSSLIRFSRGWEEFAVSNGLLEGDSLVFALTKAMSELEVFIFRSCTNKRIRIAANAKEKLDTTKCNSPCPTFFKRLTTTDLAFSLEIPLDFMKLHGSRIHSKVKLQGMHEQSPVQSMNCCKTRGWPGRHTLRADWRVFAAKNHLQVGEELLFTLASDSLFVVRKVARQAPP